MSCRSLLSRAAAAAAAAPWLLCVGLAVAAGPAAAQPFTIEIARFSASDLSKGHGGVTFGPDAAPALTAFRNMSSPQGMSTGLSVLAGSPVSVQNPAGTTGMGTPGWLRPKEDVISGAVFAKVEEGGAAVNVGSMTSIADDNYLIVQRARGDAVVVDLAVWQGLVRDAYRGYNAAIVAAVLSGRN